MIGKTDTIGQSAVNKARVPNRAMHVKDSAVLRGTLGVGADGAVKVMAESLMLIRSQSKTSSNQKVDLLKTKAL